jgi:hypothetical protein
MACVRRRGTEFIPEWLNRSFHGAGGGPLSSSLL